MKSEDNDLLTLVENGARMGRFLRHYWAPAIRSGAVEAGGAPLRLTLFGDKFVVFRSANGEVGVVNEACPHRGVSLALASNEGDGLRCIFHGWKLDRSGALVDAPCEPEARRAAFCKAVRTSRYAARDVAGIIWVYLGSGEPPPFPDFEFNGLAPDQVVSRRAVVRYNWLQGLEAHIDSSHVGILHSGFLTNGNTAIEPKFRANLAQTVVDRAPVFEMQEKPYGLQESALRELDNGETYARIREIVLPFGTFIPGPDGGQCNARFTVPIDDSTCTEWYIVYDPLRPLAHEIVDSMFRNTSDDPDDFAANLGESRLLWGQSREAMKKGHFSGLTKNLFFEDFIVQESAGVRVDRSKEQLGVADAIIVRTRRMLKDAVVAYEATQSIKWRTGFDYQPIRARSVYFKAPKTWRDFAGDNAPQLNG
jgi:phenylpropionate dioxygenase-like ring-hydroxylating dioxygenase large terminal subunit